MPLVTSGAAHVISTVVTSIIVLVTFCTGSVKNSVYSMYNIHHHAMVNYAIDI